MLRHDDRGAGQSTRPTGPPSYRALVGDTRAAIAFVRHRGDIDPRRIFLVGHSEGAKTCEVLAAEDVGIAGFALLAGATAVNVDTLLEEQVRLEPDGFAPRLMPTHHAVEAAALIEGGGNRGVEVRTFPGLSHVFTGVGPGIESSPEARRGEPSFANALATWTARVASR